ncbi:hypothetical protein BCR35DRAFT_201028 [Leucosporidium creatinivorum]|uniref:Uncharacterized protein n=1 Tax=Leucosporidium creatinivorum TaxID=106004 RepID=A0A1Y2DL43_9BASI|nr:hypothetical protein BCR35DRAFT_201028 [Leucosporidium creatinivorum]
MSAPAAAAPAGTTAAPAAGQAQGQGDALDKAVDFVGQKAGHRQSRGVTEKISDGIRSIFKKATGKDVPVKDQFELSSSKASNALFDSRALEASSVPPLSPLPLP